MFPSHQSNILEFQNLKERCLSFLKEQLKAKGFEFVAPTTRRNSMRVLRAMQLKKPAKFDPLEIEHNVEYPEIWSYSSFSICALQFYWKEVQTDMMDLLGSDLPVESDEGMQFAWSDGILLQIAEQKCLSRSWVILSNALRLSEFLRVKTLVRGMVGKAFLNLLNRFTKVYVDELVEEDHLFICRSLHPSVPECLLKKLIAFNKCLYEDTMVNHKFGQSGSPWEFNLRDIIHSCQIIEGASESSKDDCFLYVQRMRSSIDRQEVIRANEGKDIINEAIGSYLSINLKSCLDSSLCLPGGWPTPLMRMLHDMVFPKADRAGLHTTNRTQFDVALANKKLLFAANWSIEQATINNLKVYVLWLGWLSDQLQGYCSFFSSFLKLLNEEMNHSSWNCIKQSHEVLRKDLILQPMLSLDHANLTGNQHLINKCVGLLRLSHQQWHAETEFKCSDKTRPNSPNGSIEIAVSANSELWFLAMQCKSHEVLRKDLILQPMLSLDHANLTGNQHLINKCVGLLRLSHQQWHAETEFKYSDKTRPNSPNGSIEMAVSANSELWFLAMQCVCMSAFIMSKVDEGDFDVLKQMEEMYQTLLSKFIYEKDKLEKNLENAGQASLWLDTVVFRSDTGKYKKLRSECDEFLKLVATPFDLLRKLVNLNLQQQADVSDITSLLWCLVTNWKFTLSSLQYCDDVNPAVVFRSDIGKCKKLRLEYDEFLKLVATPFDLLRKVANLNLQQVVFRSDTGKCKKLRSECDEFLKLVATPFDILKEDKTATLVMDGLSNEYSEYVDILQPVQIAIDEMKFRVVIGAVKLGKLHDKLSYFDKSFPTYMDEYDMNMVETLITSARDNNVDEAGSILQIKATIHQNILLRVVHYVAQAHFLDNASFKPRAFDLKNVIEIDSTALESSNEAFSEWQELASEEVEASVEKVTFSTLKGMSLDKEMFISLTEVKWVSIAYSAFQCITSCILVKKDHDGLMCSSLESKLIPEHVLHLCLEHDRNSVASHLPTNAYNFYKDSNDSLSAKMVDPKIVDVIDMILSIPMNTPLAKVEKYTEDVPKEQAIWYLDPYNESTSGSSEEDINFD
ncbi:ATPase [Artemisia annua]|uniref:ATPase n=1 Tax=Artemisia annua TaxID=35608 RepID=A0A2U1M3G4_ARTAN|nr:ATPase [Artemisia annua]